MKTRAQLRSQYTSTLHAGKGEWFIYLDIGHQHFRFSTMSSKRQAEWERNMIAAALETLFKNETKP